MSNKIPKSSNKDLNNLIKLALKNDWRWKKGGGGHIKLFSPDKKTVVVVSVSTKSKTALQNAKETFRRGGLEI